MSSFQTLKQEAEDKVFQVRGRRLKRRKTLSSLRHLKLLHSLDCFCCFVYICVYLVFTVLSHCCKQTLELQGVGALSCCRGQALGACAGEARASVVAATGPRVYGSRALDQGLSSCGAHA